MDKKLYAAMDWPRIEGVVYSEEDNPHQILGAEITKDGVLVQTFQPGALSVSLRVKGVKKLYPMEMVDEDGYFAVLLPRKTIPEYVYEVEMEEGKVKVAADPYNFQPQIDEQETKKFNKGICYDIYERLGAHPMTLQGKKGVYFAVWAPAAMRVSVVGDFNDWDGRIHPMRRLWDSGIFELFLPDVKVGSLYKFEIKAKGGLTFLKSDPYGNQAEYRPGTASIVTDLTNYQWKDQKWLDLRDKTDSEKNPMLIYEMHLGSWKKPEDDRYFYNYRELAPMIAEYVKEMGYTHVELMPVMEHPLDASWGYQVTGYYAPTSRYGTPEDFMYFMDYMHEQGIGVILDWVPAHFPKDTGGLSNFDGTCLYEHQDPRQGYHPHWGTLIYNYGRPEVSNFLISNALFWAEKYHVDGIRMDAVASMLYLDYGKNDGEWVANMYGTNENLEAVELLKHLNSVFKEKYPGTLLIAEESTSWANITAKVKADGLGFDYKWNMGWMNDFVNYMSMDPIFRGGHHHELTFSMVYAYSEKFVLTLSHDEVVHGKCSMWNKMPGERSQKFANLRAAYGYMMAHPGKKLLFMGQDFAQEKEWSEETGLDWDCLNNLEHQQLKEYYRDLQIFYKSHPAMYQEDFNPEGFTWINEISANENILVFTRNTSKKEETLLIICNFSHLPYSNHKVGVPYPGKYKEIFNSDLEKYGGLGIENRKLILSQKSECDDREDSIYVKVPPMGMTILSYQKTQEKVPTAETARKKASGKTTGKNLKEELEKKFVEENK